MRISSKLAEDVIKRPRGRPRGFAPEEILQRIRDVFIEKGFAGASLDALSEAAGLNRPSFYAAFGDKGPIGKRLAQAFKGAIDIYIAPPCPRGCMRRHGRSRGTKPAELRAYAASLIPRDMPMTAPYPWSTGFKSLLKEHDYRIEDIDGEVPPTLRGTLFRNGSGRNELGGQWFAHWFDGDGMIQAIRFDAEGIHYRNRFVATKNYRDESRAGRIVHRGFGKMRPGGVLGNAFRPPANVSNTSVTLREGRLLSLWEGGPPYEVDPATLETRGVADFDGMLKAFSAHPRIDPDSGALFNFGIDYGPRTILTPYRLHRGAMTRLAPVTLPYPLMNHDFVLTERYLVFCLGPVLVRPVKFVLGLTSFDSALHWDGGKPTLILLIPRDGGPPRFIETDAFFQFHFANGYEEDGSIVLDLVRYPDYTTVGQALRDYWRSEWPADGMAKLTRMRLDLSSGAVESRAYAAGTANEFPRFHPTLVGKRYRYAYIACNPAGRVQGLQQQVARVDLDSGAVATHDFGPDGYVGEPVFIPTGIAEDDGVVVTMVFDAATERSVIVGLDARDVAARPIFTAWLRHHVPYSLHGCFSPD